MWEHRSRKVALCLIAAIAALIVPWATALGETLPGSRLSSGPHAPAPTGAELARLVALHDHAPRLEGVGDISTLVVTHSISVKLATDEEWRAYYGTNSMTVANNALEAADNAMFSEFGIDFYWYTTYDWDSAPDSARSSCSLLGELASDASPGTADVLLGFAKNLANSGAGCAEVPGDEAEVNWNSSSYNRWVTTQHELSHLFGAPDRYPDPDNLHANDVMENQYDAPDFWCTGIGYWDWLIVRDSAGKFD